MKLTTSQTALGHATALLMLATPGWAAPVLTWTGSGGSPNWSVAANWNLARPPAEGDAVVFDGAAGAATTVDLSLRLDTLSFAAGAGAFPVQVAGEGGRSLNFGGLGIQNLTGASGPIRQSLVANAGNSGASLIFEGASGINLGAGTSFRPMDLSAAGGTAAGQVGGRIVFQDQSSTGLSTFNSLRANGAALAGAGAGALAFRGNAIATRFTTLTMAGGTAPGAAGGQGSFADSAGIEGTVNVLSGSAGGGSGGRALFSGTARAALTSTLNIQGGWAGSGSEGFAEFRGASRLAGTASNAPANEAGGSGGRVEFRDQSAFDSGGYDGSLGSLQLTNRGSGITGAGGGSVVFRDDSETRGRFLVILNGSDAESTEPDAQGGITRFTDRSRAGELTLNNEAGRSASAAGRTSFENTASAGTALIVQHGGAFALSAGGRASFIDSASAAGARVENNGGRVAGAGGGQTLFQNSASAGSATLINAAGSVSGASGGVTQFTGQSGAGNAYITNRTSLGLDGGGRGSTSFAGASSAQNATIDNEGGLFAINAFTTFSQSATAGSARITNFGGRAAGAGGGQTGFSDNATAGSASLVMAAGGTAGAEGGRVTFFAGSSAGSAALDLRGASVVGAEGGKAHFQNDASAGSARLSVEGSQANNPGGPEGAVVTFNFNATAASASFVVGGNSTSLGSPGRVRFDDAATAANASFTNLAGYDIGGRVFFEGTALNTASAGNARITNGSRAVASGSSSDFGGSTSFGLHSSADHAVIVNEAGRTAFGAQTVFRGDATAADALITNAGGQVGDRGGITFFLETSRAGRAVVINGAGASGASGTALFDNAADAGQAFITASGATVNAAVGGRTIFASQSTAGLSTLVAEGGSNGGSGGRIEFQNLATGGSARVVLGAGSGANAGGTLDISGVAVWVAVGSIEGGGQVQLGARSLIVAGPGSTTFSGLISGTAPAVFPSLTVQGSLTLTGANLYAGRTVIGDGVNPDSGKLIVANTSGSATGSGEVRIQRGGTLAGSGFIAGPVTLQDGGTIAPGDPVTLTLRDSLTWDGGGVIRLVLGADAAGSDHLRVGTLARGAGGPFVFDLVDAGIVVGAAYDLLSFDTLSGFVASDFQTQGFDGALSFQNGRLAFIAIAASPAVPEASQWALLIAGLAMVGWTMRLRVGRDGSGQDRVH